VLFYPRAPRLILVLIGVAAYGVSYLAAATKCLHQTHTVAIPEFRYNTIFALRNGRAFSSSR